MVVEVALVGVLGISSSTGSSLGNGRFGDGAAAAVSAIVSGRAGSYDIRWTMVVIGRVDREWWLLKVRGW